MKCKGLDHIPLASEPPYNYTLEYRPLNQKGEYLLDQTKLEYGPIYHEETLTIFPVDEAYIQVMKPQTTKPQVRAQDNVNSPSHYNQFGIECIIAIQASMSLEQFKGYLKGNVEKYIWRYSYKNGLEDLKKAQWYLTKLIEVNDKNL